MRIASIDDDQINRLVFQSYSDLLEKDLNQPVQIISYGSGEDFLADLPDSIPDIIFLDRRMPDQTGDDICAYLRKHNDYKHVPIVFLSAWAMQEEIDKGMSCGADLYITKPFEYSQILDAIKKLL